MCNLTEYRWSRCEVSEAASVSASESESDLGRKLALNPKAQMRTRPATSKPDSLTKTRIRPILVRIRASPIGSQLLALLADLVVSELPVSVLLVQQPQSALSPYSFFGPVTYFNSLFAVLPIRPRQNVYFERRPLKSCDFFFFFGKNYLNNPFSEKLSK